jgi:hypothetical protein
MYDSFSTMVGGSAIEAKKVRKRTQTSHTSCLITETKN